MAPRRTRAAAADAASGEAGILDVLRAAGGRLTTGRRAIVRALVSSRDHHVTAEDLARAVQVDHPDVHLSTVYRTLDALEAAGVVDRVNLGGGGAVFHLIGGDHAHHHLICSECGRVVEVGSHLLEGLARSLVEEHDFELGGCVVLAGRCAACRAHR